MDRAFYSEIKKILTNARDKVYQTANFTMVEAYWQIGKSIVKEQNGEERAEYGTGLLKELSKQMTQDFGRGFTVANLKNMRQFYLIFPNGYALRSELSWTHYRLLMRVENDNARQFYMDEAVKSQWSTRQLERQINTFFYERLLSSKNKENVAQEIQTLEPEKTPEDIIRDPYVLEFLGLLSYKLRTESLNITLNVYHSIFSYLEESVQNFSLNQLKNILLSGGLLDIHIVR